MKLDLRSLDLQEMQNLVLELAEPKFRAGQLCDWIHKKGISNLDSITNLNKKLLHKLREETTIATIQVHTKQISQDGTTKFLLKLADDNYIECVLMRYRGTKSKQRNTICISSQVGCAMGCTFCATGMGGFARNLSVGEILGQVYAVNNILKEENAETLVGNVVFMGMGEPLLNYDNVLKAITILNSSAGQNISLRRISLSTCGIVPKIKELAEEKLDIVLAISLHAPTDELRSKIMPVDKKYPLKELKQACKYYNQLTNKRITFEYALVADFNDQKEHAVKLAEYLQGLFCHVNIIPVNSVGQIEYQKPSKKRVKDFQHQLTKLGIEVSIREEKGVDIDAACGQLRGKVVE